MPKIESAFKCRNRNGTSQFPLSRMVCEGNSVLASVRRSVWKTLRSGSLGVSGVEAFCLRRQSGFPCQPAQRFRWRSAWFRMPVSRLRPSKPCVPADSVAGQLKIPARLGRFSRSLFGSKLECCKRLHCVVSNPVVSNPVDFNFVDLDSVKFETRVSREGRSFVL